MSTDNQAGGIKIQFFVGLAILSAVIALTLFLSLPSLETITDQIKKSLSFIAPDKIGEIAKAAAGAVRSDLTLSTALVLVVLLLSVVIFGVVFFYLLLKPIGAVARYLATIVSGDLKAKPPQAGGEFGTILSRLNSLSSTLDGITTRTSKSVQQLKEKDFTQLESLAPPGRKGEDTISKGAGENLHQSLSAIGGDLKTVQKGTTDASMMVASALGLVSDMSNAVENQTNELAQMATAVQQNSVAIDHIAHVGTDARDSVNKIVHDINSSTTRMAELSDSIMQIQDSTGQITSIVTVIQDIADQTNLLSLNAAIEAARAGEQGRGFAVVADEVRKLAEKVGRATQDVVKLIKETEGRVSSGVRVVTEIVEENRNVHDQVIKIQDGIGSLASAVAEQSASMMELRNSSNRIAEESVNINTTSKNILDNTLEIVNAMDSVAGVVNQYKLT